MPTMTDNPTDIEINGAGVESVLGATFYESDGLLEVSEAYDDTVLAKIQLTPDATEQQMHIALEEAFGLAGHFIASFISRES